MKLLKSEKIALNTIRRLTVDLGKVNTVITNEQLEQKGLIGRNLITKATNTLHTKGLIYKVRNCPHTFRYMLSESGKKLAVYVFKELEEVG